MIVTGVKSAALMAMASNVRSSTGATKQPAPVDSLIMNAVPKAPAKTIHAIFLDVDGTYADYGVVPPAHADAVRAARTAGHKVLICTGRPMAMLPESILGAGFDGVVASAGAYLELNGSVIMNKSFPADLAHRALTVLDAHDAVYILESQNAVYVPQAAKARLLAHIAAHFDSAAQGQDAETNDPDAKEAGASSIIGLLKTLDERDRSTVEFAKISVFESPVPMAELVTAIGADIDVVANSIAAEGPHAGELFQRGISKADGVAAAIKHLGIEQADSIAFGDGENDLEMLAYAGLGVAIEGSSPELLAIASRTAAPPAQNGIATAFAELGLL